VEEYDSELRPLEPKISRVLLTEGEYVKYIQAGSLLSYDCGLLYKKGNQNIGLYILIKYTIISVRFREIFNLVFPVHTHTRIYGNAFIYIHSYKCIYGLARFYCLNTLTNMIVAKLFV
jgi:hypothetical protein